MENQSTTAHALAMRPWSGEHFAGRTMRERGGTSYAFTDRGVRMVRGEEAVEVPIRWAFGSGVQAVTPVIEQAGKWVEHRLSWYRERDRLGLTPGHDPSPVEDLARAVGIEQSPRNATRCFACHSTNNTPGVHCQNCHGDADAHRVRPSKSNVTRSRSVEVCARCHRSPDAQFVSATPEIDDPRSIRFAPVGFQASRCFQRGSGFTCVSCHDPHGETPKRSVDAVCSSCHASARGVCPRTANCAGCHMKSSSPMPGLRFTDHRIRVFSE